MNAAHRAVLRAAAASIRTRTAHFALAVGASPAAGMAVAKPGGRGEDLLYRPGHPLKDPAMAATWTFCALALLVAGRAMLRFRMRFDAPRPGGPIAPVVGIGFAVALAAAPAPIEALMEGLAIGHEPPVRRGDRDGGFQPGEGGWR